MPRPSASALLHLAIPFLCTQLPAQQPTPLPIAATTALLGQHFYLQLFPGDPGANPWGRSASNGLDLQIGN